MDKFLEEELANEADAQERCCICGEKFEGWGNNPWPVVKAENARCCDKCNEEIVIPRRILDAIGGNK